MTSRLRYNIFRGCPNSKTCTLMLRGGAEQFIEETERSLHDAIMIVRRAIKHEAIVAGGGAIEMELSKILRELSRTISGRFNLRKDFLSAVRIFHEVFLQNHIRISFTIN